MTEFKQKIIDHYDGLIGFCLTRTGGLDAAEDLAHDTIVKAIEAKDRYDERGSFSSWLCMIARNTHTNQWRRHQKYNEKMNRADKVATWTHSDPTDPPDRAIEERQECERILSGVKDFVPEPYQSVLLARASGAEYKEIAEDLGIPIGTVMSRLFRARNRMKDCTR